MSSSLALDLARRRSLSPFLLRLLSQRRPTSASAPSAATFASRAKTDGADADAPSSSPLARELKGWLRYISPFHRYTATFYRTDSAIAARAVALVLQEHQARQRQQQNEQKQGAVLVDLGCGDGAIMQAALRAGGNGGSVRRVIGYELCAQLAEEARRRCAEVAAAAADASTRPPPPPIFDVIQGDAGDADLSEADAVFLYMSAKANAQLLGAGPAAATKAATTRSARTLRPGAVVASLGFSVEGWESWQVGEQVLQGQGGGSVPFYMYVAGGGRGVEER